jgi:phosphoglucosamine mutase
VDCANGATSFLARPLFEGLGARVTAINDQPDGRNINRDCGATHPECVGARVMAAGADLGLAFDGDGDRCILADATGRVVDGDHVLFLAARRLQEQGALKGGAVVATIMSNVGLEIALGKAGIPLVRTAVGDRNVLEEMERRGANLGGEQSGHVIFLDHEPTGDGLLTGLEVLEVVKASGRPLHELAADLEVYPQVLINVRVRERADIEAIPEIKAQLDRAPRRPRWTRPARRPLLGHGTPAACDGGRAGRGGDPRPGGGDRRRREGATGRVASPIRSARFWDAGCQERTRARLSGSSRLSTRPCRSTYCRPRRGLA